MTRKIFIDTDVYDKEEYYEKQIELYKEQLNNLLLINENLIRQPSHYNQVIVTLILIFFIMRKTEFYCLLNMFVYILLNFSI